MPFSIVCPTFFSKWRPSHSAGEAVINLLVERQPPDWERAEALADAAAEAWPAENWEVEELCQAPI